MLAKVPGHTANQGRHLCAGQVLPTIIFISAFFAVLYHIGLMQIIIRGMAWIMLKTMRISGAESMNVAASIFMGQTEAPLTIRPFLSKATRSELMTIMTSGMAHVSGGIMAMYIAQGVEARHLLSAVIMTSPGTILLAKMLELPETDVPATEAQSCHSQRRAARRREPHRRHCAGDHRRRQAGVECGDYAGEFSCAGGAAGHDARLAARIRLYALGSSEPGADSWICRRAGSVADRRPMARLHGRRQPAGHAHGAERGGCLHRPGCREGDVASSVIYDCHVCAMRVYESQRGSIGMQIGGIGALVPERRNDLAKLGVRAMLAADDGESDLGVDRGDFSGVGGLGKISRI